MEESVTYQAILRKGEAKGRVEGEWLILLRMGRKRLGEPSPRIVKKIEAIVDESTFSILADRLFDVSTWDELLALP